jgi:uncharacterized membrane protein
LAATDERRRFPTSAGILFGVGLGGFFDGIVLHQILQWHHMLSSVHPVATIQDLSFNTFWDGLFHACTYVFVLLGLIILWRKAHRSHLWWSSKMLAGSMLLGFGAFNLIEGLIDHQILGIHHVNETAPQTQWLYWDVGFLIWGATMIVAGYVILQRGKQQSS